jgi:hypothetical protein
VSEDAEPVGQGLELGPLVGQSNSGPGKNGLVRQLVCYPQVNWTGVVVIKHFFSSSLTRQQNKLERLSLVSISQRWGVPPTEIYY